MLHAILDWGLAFFDLPLLCQKEKRGERSGARQGSGLSPAMLIGPRECQANKFD